MIYLSVYVLLLLTSFFEIRNKKEGNNNAIFYVTSTVLVLFCILDFGVSLDYLGYLEIFYKLPNDFSNIQKIKKSHAEFLFASFFLLMKVLGLKYYLINLITSLVTILLFVSFIYKYSKYKTLSLLVLFSLYFVYNFGILRQGLALAIALRFAYPYLVNKNYFKYYVLCGIIFFIHYSSAVLLLAPLIDKFYKLKKAQEVTILILSFLFSFFVKSVIVQGLHLIGASGYAENFHTNYGALAIRFLLFLFVYLLLYKNNNEQVNRIKNIYFVGFIIYVLLSPIDILASRIAVYYKVFDLLLIPYCLYEYRFKIYAYFFVAAYTLTVYVNTLIGISAQLKLNFYEYPYITIFNKEDVPKTITLKERDLERRKHIFAAENESN
ncbi:MAG: EpsG family protein [Sphingobacteriaceae bacterium]|nr:EpsG family protein [Sphingobacteriaceae bacterium]